MNDAFGIINSLEMAASKVRILESEKQQINVNRTGFVGDFLFKLGHLT
ncbi:hypothetical protein [Acinetobacter indicus]